VVLKLFQAMDWYLSLQITHYNGKCGIETRGFLAYVK